MAGNVAQAQAQAQVQAQAQAQAQAQEDLLSWALWDVATRTAYITGLLSNPDKVEVGIALLGLGAIEWALFHPEGQPQDDEWSYLDIVSSIFGEENTRKPNYKRYYDMLKEHFGGDDSYIPDELKPARLGLKRLAKRSIRTHVRELPTYDLKTQEIRKIRKFLDPAEYDHQFPGGISRYGGNRKRKSRKQRSIKRRSIKRKNIKKYKKTSKYSGGSRYKRKSKNKNRKLKTQRKTKRKSNRRLRR